MDDVTLKVQKLFDNAPMPAKPKTKTDSGFDVYAHNCKMIYAHSGGNSERKYVDESMNIRFIEPGVLELQQGERALIGTGLKMTMGPGYELQVRPRSGNALKRGLTIVNTPGTVDEAYRGEVGVIILNTSRQTQQIKLGEAIAQIVPVKVELPEIEECIIPDNKKRGDDGYGSTDNPEKKKTPFNFMRL